MTEPKKKEPKKVGAYKCRVCGMIYKTRNMMLGHMIVYHVDGVRVTEDQISG